jgi:hypothetical protein
MRRLTRVGVVLAALVLGLSACADGADDGQGAAVADRGAEPVDVELIASAVDDVTAASTGRFVMTLAYEGVPGLDGAVITGEGEYDYGSSASRVAIDLGSVGPGPDGGGTAPSDGSIETVTIGTTAYVGAGPLARFLPADAAWIRLDLAELAGESSLDGLQPDSFGPAPGMDPRSSLEQLQAVADVTEVGRADVRGVPTRHLAGELRLGDVAAQLDAPARDSLSGLYGGDLEALADVTVPIEVYVDAQGLIRRVHQRLEFDELAPVLDGAEPGELDGAVMEFTIDYFDFGADITVEAPENAIGLEELVGSF